MPTTASQPDPTPFSALAGLLIEALESTIAVLTNPQLPTKLDEQCLNPLFLRHALIHPPIFRLFLKRLESQQRTLQSQYASNRKNLTGHTSLYHETLKAFHLKVPNPRISELQFRNQLDAFTVLSHTYLSCHLARIINITHHLKQTLFLNEDEKKIHLDRAIALYQEQYNELAKAKSPKAEQDEINVRIKKLKEIKTDLIHAEEPKLHNTAELARMITQSYSEFRSLCSQGVTNNNFFCISQTASFMHSDTLTPATEKVRSSNLLNLSHIKQAINTSINDETLRQLDLLPEDFITKRILSIINQGALDSYYTVAYIQKATLHHHVAQYYTAIIQRLDKLSKSLNSGFAIFHREETSSAKKKIALLTSHFKEKLIKQLTEAHKLFQIGIGLANYCKDITQNACAGTVITEMTTLFGPNIGADLIIATRDPSTQSTYAALLTRISVYIKDSKFAEINRIWRQINPTILATPEHRNYNTQYQLCNELYTAIVAAIWNSRDEETMHQLNLSLLDFLKQKQIDPFLSTLTFLTEDDRLSIQHAKIEGNQIAQAKVDQLTSTTASTQALPLIGSSSYNCALMPDGIKRRMVKGHASHRPESPPPAYGL